MNYKIVKVFIILLLVLLYGCREEKYFNFANYPDAIVLKSRSDLGYADLIGNNFIEFIEQANEEYETLRLKKWGRFINLKVTDADLVDWQYIEGASVNSIIIKGDYLPEDAWQSLISLKKFGQESERRNGTKYTPRKYDSDLTIELTDQVINDAFYSGLSNLLDGKIIDQLYINIESDNFDLCRLTFPKQFNRIRVPLKDYPLPNKTPQIYRDKTKAGLSYTDFNTGEDVTDKLRNQSFPFVYFKGGDSYFITPLGKDIWQKFHCKKDYR